MARLNEPLLINGMRLRNRLALPPMTTNFGADEGRVTLDLIGYYRQRARHVGMVIVEATAVCPEGRITPYSLGLWDDAQLPGMVSLAEAIKAEGAAAVLQLNHAGARSAPLGGGIRGASPSGFAFRTDVVPTVLDQGQMDRIAADFAEAAARASAAGFDGVEVHGAHFYLLSQFLSPLTNRRDDRYGGDTAGRAAFPVEVVRAVRARVGRGYPLVFRINSVEVAEGGQTPGDAVIAAGMLEAAGVDALHVSVVTRVFRMEGPGRSYLQASSTLDEEQPAATNFPYVAQVKRAAAVPVIAVGKLGDAGAAARVVGEGVADAAAIGRQLIADPDAAGKILSGEEAAVVRCQECLTCVTSVVRNVKPLKCRTNLNPVGSPRFSRSAAR